MSRQGTRIRKIAVLAMLTALGLVCFLIENLLPSIIVPGAKIGLANIFSLAALVMYSPVEAIIVVCVRSVLGAIFAGNLSAVLYSFTGGLGAIIVASLLMTFLYPKISLMSISIVSAVVHNIIQCAVFALLSGSSLMFGYMPILALVGVASGAVVGFFTMMIFKGIPKSVFDRLLQTKTIPKDEDVIEIQENGGEREI